ncbi:MarC family protein [Xanthobacter autotrophicus DSM 431]|uniref:MarC family protein n=1 Tax=Xanthobacter nonsaccharivorans TaxID=3119912 RepID=UPI003727ECB4
MSYATNAFNIFITVFAALFPIVNPLGGAPIFLNFVRRCSPATREQLARSVAVYGFLLLLGSLMVGAQVLLFFGISLPVLRVAGGAVVTAVGWTMLHQGDEPSDRTDSEELDDSRARNQAFYPLTLPLTVGPGSIATTIALAASHQPTWRVDLIQSLSSLIGAVAGLVVIAMTVYFAFREAATIERVLGKNGTSVLVRLFAFILFAIGVQIMWLGLHDLLASVPRG